MLITALLATAIAGQDAGRIPPATPTYRLEGPLDFCAEEFSVRLQRGETVEWTEARRGFVPYTIRSGEIQAGVGRDPSYATTASDAPMMGLRQLRLPLSRFTLRYLFEIPDRTEMDARGNQRDGLDYVIIWFLYGATMTGTPLAVVIHWGDRRLEPSFVRRIDPRPLGARRCTISSSDPALARRIRIDPGR
jgi:hypothetical protein